MDETPKDFNREELVEKDFISLLDYALSAKPIDSPMENLADYWNEMLEAYLCPCPKCGKIFTRITGLRAHPESVTHDKIFL